MTRQIVIDESGVAQQWTAVYWRYFGHYKESCDTFADAFRFLAAGEDAGSLSSDSILGPDGKVLMDKRALFEATCSGVDPEELFVQLSSPAGIGAGESA